MKHAICIQCHNKPELVNFLVNYMPAEYFDFFIHIDAKANIFNQIIKKENVFFSNRIKVKWGRISQVEATLALFDMVSGTKYSYVHLISGQDFLSKNTDDFLSFFDEHEGLQFIQSNPLPERSTWSWGGGGSLFSVLS